MAEEWREIEGTGYSVSSEGRVASRKKGNWRVLKPGLDSSGYPMVVLWSDNAGRTRKVHQLVAAAFLGPKPTPLHQVNHKNGIRTDPRADNLEWVTGSQNVRHSFYVLGKKAPRGEANCHAKLTEADVRVIYGRLSAGEFQRVIAADYGVDQTAISLIARGVNWGWLEK